MLTFRHGFVLGAALLASGCAKEARIEWIRVTPDVPAELRQPVEPPKRKVAGLKDVGLVLADQAEALDKANGQIAAIDCILTAAENDTEVKCLEATPPQPPKGK